MGFDALQCITHQRAQLIILKRAMGFHLSSLLGQGDPRGQHQAGVGRTARGPIFHNASFRESHRDQCAQQEDRFGSKTGLSPRREWGLPRLLRLLVRVDHLAGLEFRRCEHGLIAHAGEESNPQAWTGQAADNRNRCSSAPAMSRTFLDRSGSMASQPGGQRFTPRRDPEACRVRVIRHAADAAAKPQSGGEGVRTGWRAN
jgi:hypothetical protein